MRKRFGRVLPAVLVGAVAVAVVLIGAVYFRFISLRIYEDSTGHLEEIYGQVNRTFGAFLDRNWGLLDSCNEYFTLVSEADDRVVSDFVARKKEYWRFSDFYFLSTADQTCLPTWGRGTTPSRPPGALSKRACAPPSGTTPSGRTSS